MPIKKHTPEWAKDIDQKEVELYKKRLNIWANIYHWRKYRWYSQKELAQKSELTQSIISTLEKWEYNPSLDVLTKLSSALNVPLEVLTKNVGDHRSYGFIVMLMLGLMIMLGLKKKNKVSH